jgi:hypothetical protein
MQIKQLVDFLDGNFEKVPKKLGLELVNLGFLNYTKLTADNYDYWWYETDDISKIDKKKFTFKWDDLIYTRKMKYIKYFIQFHKETGCIYNLFNSILNIEPALFDGVDIESGEIEFKRQIQFYYGKTELDKYKTIDEITKFLDSF